MNFSLFLFILFTLVAYMGVGVRAAWASGDRGQTIGQRLFDYVPQGAGRTSLSKQELLVRHALRLAAAPLALLALMQGQSVDPQHDRWTGTLAVTLGDSVPVGG